MARRDHQPVSAALVAHGAHDHGRGNGAVIQQTSYPVRCQHFRHPPREGVRQKAIVKPDGNRRFHAVRGYHVRKSLRNALYVLLGEVLTDDPAEASRSECDFVHLLTVLPLKRYFKPVVRDDQPISICDDFHFVIRLFCVVRKMVEHNF